jgi:hypothetical protein
MASGKTESGLPSRAREVASILCEGRATPHRSCGVAIAETFHRNPLPYAGLRKGGITGRGECGAIKAGDLVLVEILGPADPLAALTDTLRASVTFFRDLCAERLALARGSYLSCDEMVGRLGEFGGPARKEYCTRLAGVVAEALAETILRFGGSLEIAEMTAAPQAPGEQRAK